MCCLRRSCTLEYSARIARTHWLQSSNTQPRKTRRCSHLYRHRSQKALEDKVRRCSYHWLYWGRTPNRITSTHWHPCRWYSQTGLYYNPHNCYSRSRKSPQHSTDYSQPPSNTGRRCHRRTYRYFSLWSNQILVHIPHTTDRRYKICNRKLNCCRRRTMSP